MATISDLPEPLNKGFTVWFTGLSGSGKSTLAALLARELAARQIAHELLDGDEVRTHLCRDLGFTRKDRDENVRRLGYVSSLLSRHGIVPIVAAISPFRAARDEARQASVRFLEVHVHCPLETLVRRDPKGLYRLALNGQILHFTGISDPYEAPLHPDIQLRTDCHSKEESLMFLLEKLEELGWLPRRRAHRRQSSVRLGIATAYAVLRKVRGAM